MLLRKARLSFVAGALALSLTPSAFAVEPEEFAARLEALTQAMGVNLSFAEARMEGETLFLSDPELIVPGEDPITMDGDLIFENVGETPDGDYTAARATIADIEFDASADDEEPLLVAFRNFLIEDIVLPAEMTGDELYIAAYSMFSTASLGPVTGTTADGTEVFGIERMAFWTGEQDGVLVSGFEIEDLRGDLGLVPDPEAQEFIDAFEIEQVNAHMRGEVLWDPQSGEMAFEEMSITLDDLARIDLTGVVTGYTLEFYSGLMDLNLEMAELGEEATEDDLMEIDQRAFEMMATLGIAGGSIRYEDNSLFAKALDFTGAQQGVDGQTIGFGLRAMVPMLLAELGDPQFTAMVSGAINQFFDDPQSLTITAAPDEPVVLTEVPMIAEDPIVLIETLNLQVVANE